MRQARLDWGKLLGCATLAAALVCLVSGLALAWQATFGPRIMYWLDVVHTWSGFLLVPLIGWHLVRIWIRARKRVRAELLVALRRSQWRLVWTNSAMALLLLAVGGILALAYRGPDISAGVPPQTYSLK